MDSVFDISRITNYIMSNWVTLISTIAAVVTIAQYFKNGRFLTRRSLIEDYDLAKKVIKEKNEDDYLLEQGFLYLTKKRIPASVIKFLLNQRDPMIKINQFSVGQNHLDLVKNSLGRVIDIKLKKKRLLRVIWSLFWYFIFSMLAFFPFWLTDDFPIELGIRIPKEFTFPVIYFCLSNLFLAIVNALSAGKVFSAWDLSKSIQH